MFLQQHFEGIVNYPAGSLNSESRNVVQCRPVRAGVPTRLLRERGSARSVRGHHPAHACHRIDDTQPIWPRISYFARICLDALPMFCVYGIDLYQCYGFRKRRTALYMCVHNITINKMIAITVIRILTITIITLVITTITVLVPIRIRYADNTDTAIR